MSSDVFLFLKWLSSDCFYLYLKGQGQIWERCDIFSPTPPCGVPHHRRKMFCLLSSNIYSYGCMECHCCPPPLQITTTFPKDPQYTFSSAQRFPIENRDILGETQVRNILTKSCLCKVNRKSSTGWVWIGSGVHYAAFRTTNISFIHL